MAEAIVLVTGTNRGMGYEIARQLVERGAQTVVTARRTDAAEEAARELGTALGMELDVTSRASAEAAARAVRERFGRLTALINNAGILIDETDSLLETDEEVLHQTLETNTLGPLRVARACWQLLSPGGRIVNMSSGGGQLSEPAD